MPTIKILFCIDTLLENQDGVSNTYHRILESIPSGVNAFVITPQPPQNTEFNFPIHTCPSVPIPFYNTYRLAIPDLSSQTGRLFKKFNPDVIHWSSPSPLGRFAVSYGKKHKISTTTIYHTHFNGYVDFYLKRISGISRLTQSLAWPILNFYRKTDRILVPSTSMEKFLRKVGIAPHRIFHWSRGVDCDKFSPKHLDPSFSKSLELDSRPTLLFVSRLVRIKDTDTLLNVYKRGQSSFNFVIVGDGPDRIRLEKKMPDAKFLGHLTGNDLARVYASCDLFIFPSTTETFGNVVLEAMASKLPVVAADQGGPRDILSNTKNGLLIEPGNAEAFVEACMFLINNPRKKSEISENALAYAQKQKWSRLREEFFEHLYQLHSSYN